MRKKIYCGITLLLIVGLLAGCNGVKQADVDAANAAAAAAQAQATTLQSQIATANAAAAKAQSDLAAAQKVATDAATKAAADLAAAQKAVTDAQSKATADLAAANSARSAAQADLATAKAALDKANADLAAANKTIADLKAAGGGTTGPKLSFTPKTYTDTTNKFSFSYPSNWTTYASFVASDTEILRFNDPANSCPGVYIYKYADSTQVNLADLFTKNIRPTATPAVTSTATKSNSYGINADVVIGTYFTSGSTYDTIMYGFKANGFWWVLRIYQLKDFGDLQGGGTYKVYSDEIFSTWQFTK